jgi:hypothetical protein
MQATCLKPPKRRVPTLTLALSAISGTLDANDVDMFAIYIADPSAFRAETNTSTTNFDSQLWLFDVNGNGIVHDDDSAGSLRSRITNANNCIPGPGIYYIAISRWNRDPSRLRWSCYLDKHGECVCCCWAFARGIVVRQHLCRNLSDCAAGGVYRTVGTGS